MTVLKFLFILLLSFFAAFFMTYAQQSKTLDAVLHSERFWIAVGWSFLPALTVIAFVLVITYRLDFRYDWRKQFQKRLKMQWIYGMTLPVVFLIGYFSIYYATYNKSIVKRKYFQIEFPMSLLGITVLNFASAAYYAFRPVKTEQNQRPGNFLLQRFGQDILQKEVSLFGNGRPGMEEGSPMPEKKNYTEEITVSSGKKQKRIKVQHIICLLKWEQAGLVLLDNGKVYGITRKLDYYVAMLDERYFARSNRWCIINLHHVQQTEYNKEAVNSRHIIYKASTGVLLGKMSNREKMMLGSNGVNGDSFLKEKYRLNRSYKEAFEKKLELLI